MNDEANDILISAYLDGELSAEERAKVDALLADSADARQTLEELKAIRTSLQNLPRYRLGPSFAQSVLERAQEQAPAEQAPQPAKVESAKVGSTPMSRQPVPASVFRSWRGYAWSAIAVAAAVMIMVATRPPNGPAEKEVARAPVAAKTTQSANQPELNQPAFKKAPADALAESQPMKEQVGDQSRSAMGLRGAEGERSRAMDVAGQARPAGQAAESRGGLGSDASGGDAFGGGGFGGAGGAGAPAATTPAPATPPAEALANGQVGGVADMERQQSYAGALDAGKLAMPSNGSQSESLDDLAQAGKDHLLVVQCEITSEAAKREFDRVLERNDIAFVNEPSKDAATQPAGGAGDYIEKGAESANHDDARKSTEQMAVQPFTCVYVEARPEQIAATIAEMNRAKDDFRSVSAGEAPTDEALAAVSGKGDARELAKRQSAADDKSSDRQLEDKVATLNGAAPPAMMQKQLGKQDAPAISAEGEQHSEPAVAGVLKGELARKPTGMGDLSLREKEADKTANVSGMARRISNLEELSEYKKKTDKALEADGKVVDMPADRRRDFGSGGRGGGMGGASRVGGANSFGRADAATASPAQAAPTAAPAAPPSGVAANESSGAATPGSAGQKKAVEELKSDNFGDRLVRGARAGTEQAPKASAGPQSVAAPTLQRALFVLRQVDTPAAAAKALPVEPAAPAEKK